MSELAKGCEHFLEYRQNHGLQSFKIIYKYLVKPGQEARKLKVQCVRVFGVGGHAPTLLDVCGFMLTAWWCVEECCVCVWAW